MQTFLSGWAETSGAASKNRGSPKSLEMFLGTRNICNQFCSNPSSNVKMRQSETQTWSCSWLKRKSQQTHPLGMTEMNPPATSCLFQSAPANRQHCCPQGQAAGMAKSIQDMRYVFCKNECSPSSYSKSSTCDTPWSPPQSSASSSCPLIRSPVDVMHKYQALSFLTRANHTRVQCCQCRTQKSELSSVNNVLLTEFGTVHGWKTSLTSGFRCESASEPSSGETNPQTGFFLFSTSKHSRHTAANQQISTGNTDFMHCGSSWTQRVKHVDSCSSPHFC